MSLPAMILAAGFGTRMMPLTEDRPKPLIKVAGRALIDHALEAAEGCAPIAVNAHYRADQIVAHLAGRDVHVLEEAEILDSGGGVRNAVPVLGDGPLVTLNADAVWKGPRPVAVLRDHWDDAGMDALMLLVPQARSLGTPGGWRLSLGADGRVHPGELGHIFTGAQSLGRGVIGRWPEGVFSMREVWLAALEAGRLYGCLYPGHWADVGEPGGIALAEGMLDDV